MKFSFRRVMSLVLALVMVLGMVPSIATHAHAAGTLATINGLTASWTDASNANGSASWSASGTGITGTSTGYKQIIGRTVTTTLTLTNSSGSEATLKFDYMLTGGGSVSGAISATSGTYNAVLADGAFITITLKSPGGASSNTLSITGLSLISTSAAEVTTTFKTGSNGSYTLNGTAVTADTTVTEAAGTEYTLAATPASGYIFFGWYDETNSMYVGYDASCTYTAAADATIVPVFVSSSAALFGVGAARFFDLTEAGAYAAAGSTKTIILLNNGTVSGSHTIPAGTTLLIPFDAANTMYTTAPDHTNKNAFNTASWVKPSAYRTLTLAANANITVNGSISVSGKVFAGGGNPTGGGCGVPTDQHGRIQMTAGSKITLNSGANLYTWGYITGAGTIDALSGSKVYEAFQIRDFRGGGATTSIANDGIVFPLSQYYVQNIEVPTNYHYGAEEHVYTALYISGTSYTAGVKFIGEGAMFQPASGCVLTKDYIESTDRLNLGVAGDFVLANMSLSLAGTEIDSSTFILPITNNITININSGVTTLRQDVALLPGSEVNIAQGATLNLAEGAGSGTISDGTGYNLFVYDLDEWNAGYNIETFDPDNIEGSEKTTGLHFVHQSYDYIAVNYAPGRTYTRSASDLKDAVVNVNGTLITNGFMYTTENGASIVSSGKTGRVVLSSGAGAETWTYQAAQNDTTPVYYAIITDSAWLKNGDGTYVQTAGAAAGTTYAYCATHDCWYTGECAACAVPAYCEITWVINGVKTTQEFEANTVPSYEGETTKASDKTNHYTFAGWATTENGTVLESLPAVTEDATYYAVFTATAHADASKDHKCDACGYVMSECSDKDGDGDHLCDVCGAEDTSSHVANIEEATCGADQICTECKTVLNAATGNHTPNADDGDCTTAITCSVCGTVTTAAKAAHVAGEDDGDCTTAVKCVNCDKNAIEAKADHVAGEDDGDCTTAITCSVCGTVTTAAKAAHVAGEDDGDCTTAVKCVNCEKNAVEAKAHVDGDDANHDCDNCSATNVDDGHYGGTATCIALAVCDECGQSYGDYGDHEYNQIAYTSITATYHTVSHICKYDATHIVNDEPVEHTYVNGVCVCTATKSYTITWIVNGVETKTTVAHGAVPTAPTAEKADTAEWDYTFSHWEDADDNEYTEIPAATADVTYTAVFTSEKQVYTITWNVEGVKTTTSVAYGEIPAYNGAPAKAETAEYTYTFTGWNPAVTSVTGDATYTAQFTAKANQYFLTFNYNYEAYLKQLSVDYNVTIAADSMKYYSTHTREGYTLTGWNTAADGSGEPFDVTQEFTMPAKDVTIYAQWELNEYTITWDVEGVKTTTTVNHGETPVFAGTPTKEADAQYTYTFSGWTPEVVAATGVATYTAQFTPVLRSYDITFVVDGVETKVPTSYGQTPVIADPTKDTDAYYSYTFAGWTPEVVAVTGEATYTATWTETPVEYTVTFVIGGETFHVVKGGYGEAVDTSDLPSTDKTGYTFNGWDAEIPATFPAENIVINGSHTVNRYTITFKGDFNTELDDGFADYTITKNYGEAITAEDIAALEATLPTITGWNFLGWYNAEEVETEGDKAWEYTSKYEIPETMGAADVTVYAKWDQIKYILYVRSSIDNACITSSYMVYEEYYQTLEEFNRINAICYDGSCEDESHTHLLPAGYSFAGYKYVDGSDVTFPYSHPAEDVTIVAQFVPNNYTVIFKNGNEVHAKVTAAYGSAINLPEDPTKEGNVFTGWVDAEDNAVNLTTMPLDGMTVYASFSVDSFKLNFFATEGDAAAVATFEIPFGTDLLTGTPDDPETEEDESAPGYLEDLLTQVGAPTKEGHTFQNWNVSDVPATMPAEAVNIYGNWSVNSYNVNWVIDGEAYTTTSVAYGSAITEPETPVKEGHTFSGWTGIPATMPAQDVTVNGSWIVNTYTITFDVEGIDPITAEYGTEIEWPAYPSKTGFWFMGWSTDGKTVIALPETMPADGLALKAVWAKLSYWIYWNVEGQETGEEYKYGDIIDAPEATKASDAKYTYKFVGWKNTSDEIVEFPVTVTENMTYYAVFEQDQKVPYTVKFVDGENTVYETQIAWDGEVTLEGFEAPTKEHYTLSWTVAGEEVSFPYAMDTKEVTFVANWIPVTYTIYFYASQEAYNEGEVLHSISAPYGTEVAQGYTYTAPEGWNFTGWKTSGSLDFSFPCTMGGEDVHLIAQLSKKIYTATFVNGEWSRAYHVGYANPVSLSVNGTLDTPSDHDGYSFKGWFDETGVAYTDEYTMPAHDVTFTAKWTYTGWYTDEAGTTYLFDDEKAYFGVWSNIGGDEYWFDANSYIVKDITLINGSYYAFDHESGKFLADYTGIYTASNGDLYYVENGVAVANKGLTKTVDADGHIHYYYFGCGMANCDCGGCTGEYVAQKGNTHWAEIDNGYLVKWDYTFDENGVVIHDEDTSKNGVHLDEGVKYYYIDGVKVHYGLFIGDDGEYYYARSNGSLVVSRDYWISESHLNGVERDGAPVEEGSYTFDAEGRIVWPTFQKNGIYAEDGSLYYYVDGERTYAGLIKYTGDLVNSGNSVTADVYAEDTIYVRTNGELAVNRSYWTTKNNGLMASATYNFDEYGRMIRTNGFVPEDGGIYYYVNGSRYHAGLIMVDGDYYYVKTSGQVVTGCRYWITHTNGYDVAEGSYEFDAEGKMIIPEPEVLKNGIVEENGGLWYYVDGKPNYAGLIQYTGTLTREDGTVVNYENAWIYVRTSGELVVGRSYWVTKNNGAMKSATYQFDENGIMQ